MTNGVVLRRPAIHEHDVVRELVQTVVDEIYGGLWAPAPLPISEEDWSLAWVAVVHRKIVGMVLTNEEEISGRECRTFRLRVVKSNTPAVGFYQRHGWRVRREFPHESFPITILEMVKPARAD